MHMYVRNVCACRWSVTLFLFELCFALPELCFVTCDTLVAALCQAAVFMFILLYRSWLYKQDL